MSIFGLFFGRKKGKFESVVNSAPNEIGVYIVELDGKIVYVGRAIENRHDQKTKGLRKRLQEHWRNATNGNKKIYKYRDQIDVEIRICKTADEAKKLEAKLIRKYNTVEDGWNKRYED